MFPVLSPLCARGQGSTPNPGYHQQYLAKNPFGYRCHANTGVRFPATAEEGRDGPVTTD